MYFGCRIWDWGGAFCILDGESDKRTVNITFCRTFHIFGWVFGDLDEILGILDGDYAIWDDHLVFELIYFIF